MENFSYQVVEEETMFFDLPDGKRLKANLRGPLNGTLAVIVHGRPGSGDYEPNRSISRYLYEHDIPSLRLFLYDTAPGTRDLMDCTLDTHVADLEIVMGELRNIDKIGTIALIGHSYGALAIGRLKHNRPDLAVWLDPSHGQYWQENSTSNEAKAGDFVVGTKGACYVYPASHQEYDRNMGDTSQLAAQNYPLKIISAGAGLLKDYAQLYYDAAHEPKNLTIIPGADHNFTTTDHVNLAACQEIYQWINEHAQNRIS